MLLHLHGIGPAGFNSEDQDLSKLTALLDFLVCDWLLLVNILLTLLLSLCIFEALA
jgi:hypothetical protein